MISFVINTSGICRITSHVLLLLTKALERYLIFLKENGLDKNTIVIYTSDQGFYLGEHGWFDKRWMFEQSYSTPLLISWPGVTKPGSVNNDMVSNLDFAETLLDIAGVDVPDRYAGRKHGSHFKRQYPR